jgi:hypothetical protein
MIGLIAAAALLAGFDRAALLDAASAEFERALQHNDATALERVLGSDWMIIDSDGHPIGRERFLGALRSGALSHSEMHSSEAKVRIYGDAAIQIVRAEGEGTYRGQRFEFTERSTDVWIWTNGHWVCALTQLTRIAETAQ